MSARHDAARLPDRWDIERAIKASDDLPPIARHLLLDLCTYMDQGTTVIPYRWSPSLTGLARDTRWSRRSITRYLALLEERGWLARIRPTRHDARTRHMRTAYTVIIPGTELGTGSPGARATQTPGLGTGDAQARATQTPGLGPRSPGARVTGRLNQNLPDQPDQPDRTIAFITRFFAERSGVLVTPEWAAETARQILARPGATGKDPLVYVRRTLATDKHPERWLPTPQPPPFTERT